jgi:prevent-host-death family protein
VSDVQKFSAGKARDHFAEIVNEAAYGATRTVLCKHKKPVAAVVPIADLELLQELECLIDVREAQTALEEAKTKGAKSLAELMKEIED